MLSHMLLSFSSCLLHAFIFHHLWLASVLEYMKFCKMLKMLVGYLLRRCTGTLNKVLFLIRSFSGLRYLQIILLGG